MIGYKTGTAEVSKQATRPSPISGEEIIDFGGTEHGLKQMTRGSAVGHGLFPFLKLSKWILIWGLLSV